MEVECSLEPINKDDLKELYEGSIKRMREYFIPPVRQQLHRCPTFRWTGLSRQQVCLSQVPPYRRPSLLAEV